MGFGTRIAAASLLLVSAHVGQCDGSRERISRYVSEGQMIMVPQGIGMYEDADREATAYPPIFWFCTPSHTPDANGDGNFDHLVGHAVSFYRDAGIWWPHGYSAAWWGPLNAYEEVVVDYDDTTVMKVTDNSFLSYETSLAGQTNGFVASGNAVWAFDAAGNPDLEAMEAALGKPLTGENCNAKYEEVWKKTMETKAPTQAPTAPPRAKSKSSKKARRQPN